VVRDEQDKIDKDETEAVMKKTMKTPEDSQ
jgi:hypothetical protein